MVREEQGQLIPFITSQVIYRTSPHLQCNDLCVLPYVPYDMFECASPHHTSQLLEFRRVASE